MGRVDIIFTYIIHYINSIPIPVPLFPCFDSSSLCLDQDPSLKTMLSKLVHEMFLLNSLLNKLEEEYHHQKRLQKQLKQSQWRA
uniref:Uncharacterized protein n=1 Tax=Naja naja TaxID=35670 RepID=A0A8C7E384_NAJNA